MSWSKDDDTPTIRLCDRPGCLAAYDALAVMSGKASAKGWLSYSTFGMHMCPDDAGLWDEDAHRPLLDRVYGVATCSCGTALTWEKSPCYLIVIAYRQHLINVLGKPVP